MVFQILIVLFAVMKPFQCEAKKETLFSAESKKWQIPAFKAKIEKQENTQKEKPDWSQTLPDAYLDQVIQRKKEKIYQCAVHQKVSAQNFLVELTIEPSGKTLARLISSSQKNKEAIRCSLDILNRIQFKKFNGSPIQKGYYFQFN